MYNAICKALITATLSTSLVLMASCGAPSEEDNAKSLLAQAKECLKNGDSKQALALLDSLDHSCPTQIETRRKGMLVRSQAMTADLEERLVATDSLILVYEQEVNKLMPQFAHADVPGANGYYYLKGAFGSNVVGSTAVQARVSDADMSFYIVASNSGSKIGINQITFNTSQGPISTPIIPESDQRHGDADEFGTDLASFAPSEVDTIGSWAYSTGAVFNSAVLTGERGNRDINLSGAQGTQFGLTWRLSQLAGKLQDAKRLHDKLERQIVISRDHTVNLPQDE